MHYKCKCCRELIQVSVLIETAEKDYLCPRCRARLRKIKKITKTQKVQKRKSTYAGT